jgi:Zn-dependent protease/CBS domain-containing protein
VGNGFRVGKVFGISIRIDWSWILIFTLVTWNLGTVFSQVHPEWGARLAWSTAILAALLFFGSVLAHELAHSLVARSQGIPVRSITLFLFGGVSNIQREPSSPWAEFLITIVGPATSIVLGVVFFLLSGVGLGSLGSIVANPFVAIRQLPPLTTLLLWLGPINILLGIFNLIPGFPLDGGRVLRSILWGVTGNLRRATRWTAFIGQLVAWGMIIAGIAMVFGIEVPFFGSGLISGLWLAFIGWFLQSASAQSYHQVVARDLLEGVPVSRLMRTDVPSVSPGISVSSLVHDHIMGTDEHAFPVIEEMRLVGLVTLEDVRKVARQEWERTSVSQIMTPRERLVVMAPDDDASAALEKLAQHDIRQLPVLQMDTFVGLLRRRDLVRYLQTQSAMQSERI